MSTSTRAQPCDCSSYPTFKCITSGRLDDLIANGDLLDYGDAETTPQYIVVSSDINFAHPGNTDPYHFAPNSQILMMPGAGLDIRKEVILSEVNLFGCDTPWRSIDVLNGGILRLIGSYVSNGCRAVVLKTSARAEIISNTFTANRICVDVEGNAQLLGEGVAHNTFNGISAPACAGVTDPVAVQIAGAAYFKIGNQSQAGTPNEITNYPIGLNAVNSNIDVFHTTIDGTGSGTGIRLFGTNGVYTAKISGLGHAINDPVLLKDFITGINAHNYNLALDDAICKNTARHLINIDHNGFPTWLSLTDNRFKEYTHDAIAAASSPFIWADISGNLFLDDDSDTAGIGERAGIRWNNNQLVKKNELINIQNNDFYDEEKSTPNDPSIFNFKTFGVWLTGATGTQLKGNNFYQNYDSPIIHDFKGVYLHGSPGNLLLANDFFGNFGPNDTSNIHFRYKGVDAYNSPNNRLICNYAENLDEGFYFDGSACDHTQFRQNHMSDNLTGLYLAPGSIIGEQDELENEWEGSLPSGGVAEAHFDGDPGQQAKFMSQFSINDTNQNSDYWADPVDPTEDWFVYSGDDEIHDLLCYATLPPHPGISAANDLTIGGDFVAYKDYEASLWEARLDAYAVLAANPELRPAYSPEEAFYDGHESGNIGKLQRARLAWDTIARFTSAFEGDWGANETAIADKLDEINGQYLDMEETAIPGEQADIALTLDTLKAELDTLQVGNTALCADYRMEVTARANQLDDDLGDITTTEIWEENLKTVLRLSVAHLLSGDPEWSGGQYDTLEAIADQCRHEGGIGVVLARSAIEKYGYDDDEMCPGAEEPPSLRIRSPKVVVAPNPVSDYCQINFGQKVSGMARVRNAQGQVLYETSISEVQALGLYVAKWPQGLYLFDLHPVAGNRITEKVIITH